MATKFLGNVEVLDFDRTAEKARGLTDAELHGGLKDIHGAISAAEEMDRAQGTSHRSGRYRDEASVYQQEIQARAKGARSERAPATAGVAAQRARIAEGATPSREERRAVGEAAFHEAQIQEGLKSAPQEVWDAYAKSKRGEHAGMSTAELGHAALGATLLKDEEHLSTVVNKIREKAPAGAAERHIVAEGATPTAGKSDVIAQHEKTLRVSREQIDKIQVHKEKIREELNAVRKEYNMYPDDTYLSTKVRNLESAEQGLHDLQSTLGKAANEAEDKLRDAAASVPGAAEEKEEKSLETGVRGGKYYISPTGQKIYVKSNPGPEVVQQLPHLPFREGLPAYVHQAEPTVGAFAMSANSMPLSRRR